MFWIISWAVLSLACLLTLKPLLSTNGKLKIAGMAGVVLLPFSVYFLYQGVGTPAALDAAVHTPLQAGQSDMDALTEQLRNRLKEDPEQVEGWILLGRSYKTLQKYPEALDALETANRLVPGQPLIEVELVEARLFASGNPRITADMTARLEHAVAREPTLQKGFWLLGIAAAQAGDDKRAIEWWEKLSPMLEPGSEIAESVSQQIARARNRLGMEPPMPTTPAESRQGHEVYVELSPAANNSISDLLPGSALFIIVRAAGVTAGPPLGARRVEQPRFPLHLILDDSDSMLPERPISSSTEVTLQARLSLAGQPIASAGDWQSAPVELAIDSSEPSRLVLDHQVE